MLLRSNVIEIVRDYSIDREFFNCFNKLILCDSKLIVIIIYLDLILIIRSDNGA